MVISIIGLLSSVVLAALGSGKEKAEEAAQKMALHQTENALQLYATYNGGFPLTTNALHESSYINSVDPNVVYTPINSDKSECRSEPCDSYIISLKVEDQVSQEDDVNVGCNEGGGHLIKSGHHNVCVFTSSGTFTVDKGGLAAEVLVVAGGGGGGTDAGGGGGAGGLLYEQNYPLSNQEYQVTVGKGGTGGPARTTPKSGSNSSFGTMTAYGGGYGAYYPNYPAASGGSGGGGGNWFSSRPAAGNGISGQGHAGYFMPEHGRGGGGGAGGTPTSMAGGPGLYFRQFAGIAGSPSGWFATGGQGGRDNISGASNSGNGGSGGHGGSPGAVGGHGGSGIVIIRYLAQ